MKVLMFGWEFPPLSSGGLGTACYGLTKSLSKKGIEITFVLPYSIDASNADFLRLVSTGNIKIRKIRSALRPYMTSDEYKKYSEKRPSQRIYGSTLFDEVNRYTLTAEQIAEVWDLSDACGGAGHGEQHA